MDLSKEEALVIFNALEFPLFKTNWWEKLGLRVALNSKGSALCHRVSQLVAGESIRLKVRRCLGPYSYLESKLSKLNSGEEELLIDIKSGYYDFQNFRRLLRNVWIDKLLKYKGE